MGTEPRRPGPEPTACETRCCTNSWGSPRPTGPGSTWLHRSAGSAATGGGRTASRRVSIGMFIHASKDTALLDSTVPPSDSRDGRRLTLPAALAQLLVMTVSRRGTRTFGRSTTDTVRKSKPSAATVSASEARKCQHGPSCEGGFYARRPGSEGCWATRACSSLGRQDGGRATSPPQGPGQPWACRADDSASLSFGKQRKTR